MKTRIPLSLAICATTVLVFVSCLEYQDPDGDPDESTDMAEVLTCNASYKCTPYAATFTCELGQCNWIALSNYAANGYCNSWCIQSGISQGGYCPIDQFYQADLAGCSSRCEPQFPLWRREETEYQGFVQCTTFCMSEISRPCVAGEAP